MKQPKSVGADFDKYAKEWKEQQYKMEVPSDAKGIKTRGKKNVKLPGDEWGEMKPLLDMYKKMFAHYLPGKRKINFLEVGAGGGRSTQCVLDLIGDRIDTYTVVDVSKEFTKTLKERVGDRVEIVIVKDVDLEKLDTEKYDFCLAQSSWSHIGMYDQYRYLREFRRVMKPDAPVAVLGQFILGVSQDWTFNRFRRRVHQIDKGITGVYHEFIGVAMLAECLYRLHYNTDIIFNSGFIARTKKGSYTAMRYHIDHIIKFPYLASLNAYFAGKPKKTYALPLSANPKPK